MLPVQARDFRDTILKASKEFTGEWVDTVKARVLFAFDLPAEGAKYHKICSVNFRTGRQIPMVFMPKMEQPKSKRKKSDSGRPKNPERAEAFIKVTKFLEDNDNEQLTVNDLVNKMGEYLHDSGLQAYSFPYMKTEITNHFGDRIIIAERNGKSNVVTFHTTASKILHGFYYQSKQDNTDMKKDIMEAAGKLIKQDVRDMKESRETYMLASQTYLLRQQLITFHNHYSNF